MLTRGSGAAIQKVVAKVSDLPSPLDAVSGERIIVRETEEVYSLDPTTRMWAVVGVLKKVGGKRPEELADHLDSVGNPHKTTLAQVMASGASVALDEKTGELTLDDKGNKLKTLVRLLKTNGALRIGPDVGNSTATVWINTGKKGAKPSVIRLVDGDVGADQFVLEADGSVTSSGAAIFKKGISGPTKFDDELTAAEGVFGADADESGPDANALEIGSGRPKDGGKSAPVILSVGAKGARVRKAFLTERGLGIGVPNPTEALDVSGNLKLGGTVSSNLDPTDDHKQGLGGAKRRWKTVSTATLNVLPEADETAIIVGLKPGQKAPIILIGTDTLSLDQDGDLGLGTATPDRKLDVRGSGLAIGAPVGHARVTLADNGDGDVQLSFNRLPDGSSEDENLYGWSVVPGSGALDAFEVRRRAKGGQWRALLHVDNNGTQLTGDLSISGALKTNTSLATNGLTGAASNGQNGIAFNPNGTAIDYFAQGALVDGCAHNFSSTWKNAAKALAGLILNVTDQGSSATSSLLKLMLNHNLMFDFRKDGTLFGGSLGSSDAPWKSAYLANELSVDGMRLSKGLIESDAQLELRAKGVALHKNLCFLDDKVNVIYSKAGLLAVTNTNADATIFLDARKKSYGINFPMGGAAIRGVGDMQVETLNAEALVVEAANPSGNLASFSADGKTVLALNKDELTFNGTLTVNGLSIEKLEEDVVLDGQRAETKFKIPAGVRVEAVIVRVIDDVSGARFWQAGDAVTADRFISASTRLHGGQIVRGLNHCDRGLSVQQVSGSVVITTDAPATGKFCVTVIFMNPKA
jgi:hypothetical protein